MYPPKDRIFVVIFPAAADENIASCAALAHSASFIGIAGIFRPLYFAASAKAALCANARPIHF